MFLYRLFVKALNNPSKLIEKLEKKKEKLEKELQEAIELLERMKLYEDIVNKK